VLSIAHSLCESGAVQEQVLLLLLLRTTTDATPIAVSLCSAPVPHSYRSLWSPSLMNPSSSTFKCVRLAAASGSWDLLTWCVVVAGHSRKESTPWLACERFFGSASLCM